MGVSDQMKLSIINLIIMFILSISNAYAGKWTSKHHGINLKYNDKTWEIVSSNDDESDTFISLYDKSDGSSFLARVEYLEDAQDFEDESIEYSLAESLFNSDPNSEVIAKKTLVIGDKSFYSIDYKFNNKKFGSQLVRHAFLKKKNHVIILLFSWPYGIHVDAAKNFPVKHLAFIEGVKIDG